MSDSVLYAAPRTAFLSGRSISLRLFAIVAVTCVAFAIALSTMHVDRVLSSARLVSASTVLVVSALLLFGALLAALRLWFMASDIGQSLSARDALLALSVGQIAGALTVQYFGQIAARSVLLGPRGMSPPANIVLATYERFIAAAVAAMLAMLGAWYLFGGVDIDMQAGGDRLFRIAAGLVVAVAAGAAFGWGDAAFAVMRRHPRRRMAAAAIRSACLTLVIQLCTVAAYVVAAHSLAPQVSMSKLVAASAVVTFVASLPISFAGWGVRELSAVLALGSIGLHEETALIVALFIGAAAMMMVVAIAAGATLLPEGRISVAKERPAGPEYGDIVTAVQFILPLLAATAMFFQVFLPVGTTLINVNLADPAVMLGGALFALSLVSQGPPRWRLGGLNVHFAVATAALVIAYLHGLISFGWSDWAFTNKLLGWLVLLAYGATGALIVRVSDEGMTMLVRTVVGVACGIVVLELACLAAMLLGFNLPDGYGALPLVGFSQNRNAFAFILMLALCGATMMKGRSQGWIFGVLFAGLWFVGSRASFGALLAVLVVGLIVHAIDIRRVALGAALACATVLVLFSLPYVPGLFTGGEGGDGQTLRAIVFPLSPVSSDLDRFRTMWDGLAMFLSHPLFGSGLGAYAASQASAQTYIVIHSTPIWLLAEMGLVGFLVFAVPAVRMAWCGWRAGRGDPAGQMLLLMMVTFGVMSQFHELLYQRPFWLLLGAALACVPATVKFAGNGAATIDSNGRAGT